MSKSSRQQLSLIVGCFASNVSEKRCKKCFALKIVYRKMCIKMCGVCRGEYQLIGVGARGAAKV